MHLSQLFPLLHFPSSLVILGDPTPVVASVYTGSVNMNMDMYTHSQNIRDV